MRNKDFDNSKFYHSKEWKKVSAAYMTSRNYICERCGRPAVICHHRSYLNGQNVNDPELSLSFSNLEALCQECHNQEHSRERSLAQFDNEGNVIGVKKGRSERQFEIEKNRIDELIKKMTVQNGSESIFKR